MRRPWIMVGLVFAAVILLVWACSTSTPEVQQGRDIMQPRVLPGIYYLSADAMYDENNNALSCSDAIAQGPSSSADPPEICVARSPDGEECYSEVVVCNGYQDRNVICAISGSASAHSAAAFAGPAFLG